MKTFRSPTTLCTNDVKFDDHHSHLITLSRGNNLHTMLASGEWQLHWSDGLLFRFLLMGLPCSNSTRRLMYLCKLNLNGCKTFWCLVISSFIGDCYKLSMLNKDCYFVAFGSIHGSAIPFELWGRFYHPNTRDQLMAKCLLPLAKLLGLVTMSSDSVSSQSYSLPLLPSAENAEVIHYCTIVSYSSARGFTCLWLLWW